MKLLALVVMGLLLAVAARAQGVVVGVNWQAKGDQLPAAEQEATLAAMQAAGVHVIRGSVDPNDKGLEFLQRAQAHGIRMVWIVNVQYAPGAPPPSPPQVGSVTRHPGLTEADPERFKQTFGPLLEKLDQRGITLAGLELDNEFNWVGNGDFTIPGEGRIFGLGDLQHDKLAERVAKGFVQYVKVAAELRAIRDHLKLNQHTPIISGGLADWGTSGPLPPMHGDKVDSVSVNATLQFLRANGIDKYVDGYGVHTYPTSVKVGSREGANLRMGRLDQSVLAECRAPGSKDGKPCWVTEWGFNIDGESCPVNDGNRRALVQEMRGMFARYAQQGRLKGLLFFAWTGTGHGPREDRSSIVRCGGVTESGRLALAPL